MSGFIPTEPHPVLPVLTAEQALAMGAERWLAAMEAREKAIAGEVGSPLWKAWEPPIWKVCDALWGAPWLPEAEANAIRLNLGFKHPVHILTILGGWSSSKTEYAAIRMSRLMQGTPGIYWFLHETRPSQIDQQDPIVYKYLPPELKTDKAVMGKVGYVAYKQKTGFSEGSFVLPNKSTGRMWTYEGGVDKLQGPTVRAAWGDELMPTEFVTAIGSRVARAGAGAVFFITFAPIHGHTATVQEFCDGAKVCREVTAFLNPADGGPRDPARYLGLTEEEFQKLRVWFDRGQKPPFPNVPFSRPEDCSAWLRGESGQRPVADGRRFKKVPRVLKPADPEERRAVVLFNGSDNPYGNPYSVYSLHASAPEELGNRYWYGFTKQSRARMFPKFSDEVHVIPDKFIPTGGTNYMLEDPASGRNPFRLWIRATEDRRAYVYREWPGNYEIPEVGVPGPWAVPSGKLGDGAQGPGQESFGFGLLQLKKEVARLEGWTDAQGGVPQGMKESDWIKSWSPNNGAREVVLRRFLDSRAASAPHIENDRPTTLLENYADIGLSFELTPGDDISEGVILVNDLLSYDTGRKVDGTNCPRLMIAASCVNLIFAIKIWKNQEGRRGATKDPIDLLRYFALLDLGHVSAESYGYQGQGGNY